MDLFEAIKGRRSIRRFVRKEVPEEHVKRILEAAIWAPSAGNLQPWEFIIIRDEKVKTEIARAALGQMWITEAPVVVVVCANELRSARHYGERGRSLYCIQDTAAATQNMLLAAHALGYGTCWVGAFLENEVKQVLNLPEHVRPVAIIPIGVPGEKPAPRPRIPLNQVVHYEKY
ncbi:MAG: nitroreductase family protein [Candidatus Methanomethylicota archaeon]|mgnify:CR=1 FL=1|nr:nitroreductase family protein [Candidatus Culexmicrobium cathedralense]RLE48949.1 MAG: nitroreductase family protein [Candidatus Verstraetearchaeota archaeon]